MAAAGLLRLQRSVGNAAVVAMLGAKPQERVEANSGLMGGPITRRLALPVQRDAGGALPVQLKKVQHTPGKKVDTYLKTSPFFKSYVAAAMKGGTTAEGAVKIHNAADFKKAWVAYALVRTNPDTGKTFTQAEATAWEPTVNAFQGDAKIHIHEERGEAGTAIHESLHLFTHSSYAGTYGFNVNEGTTEVFTRKLCAEQSIRRGTFYAGQRASVDKLMKKSGEGTLANAYFHGKLAELKSGVDGATKSGTFDKWVGKMKKGKYADADALL